LIIRVNKLARASLFNRGWGLKAATTVPRLNESHLDVESISPDHHGGLNAFRPVIGLITFMHRPLAHVGSRLQKKRLAKLKNPFRHTSKDCALKPSLIQVKKTIGSYYFDNTIKQHYFILGLLLKIRLEIFNHF